MLLRVSGLTGVAGMVNFGNRDLQMLKERAHSAYEYAGKDFDMTRDVPE